MLSVLYCQNNFKNRSDLTMANYEMLSKFDVKCKKCGNVGFVKPAEHGTFYCAECRTPLFKQNYYHSVDDFVRTDIDENDNAAFPVYI